MADIKEIDDFFDRLTNEFLRIKVPEVIAEHATAFFKERFTTKEWDGELWQPAKKTVTRGTLMVRSANLKNSIRPKEVTPSRVVISAGNEDVNYARIHNEGGVIDHPGGTPFFIDEENDRKAVFVSKAKARELVAYRGILLPFTKPHKITIPKRQFMGTSQRLKDYLFLQLKKEFDKFSNNV